VLLKRLFLTFIGVAKATFIGVAKATFIGVAKATFFDFYWCC